MSARQNKAVESLYSEHKDHVYNYILQLAQDQETAEDVTQHTFLKLLDDPNIHTLEHPKAYLFTVSRNTLKDLWKKKKELPLLGDNSEESLQDEGLASEPEKISLDDSVANSLHITIKRMPTRQRELMLLRYRDDLSYQEIVDITGRKLSDVKVGIHRARLNFDKKFTHEMYAKIAGERKRCPELEALLAGMDQSALSDTDLETLSKHIEKCPICSEDESTLKKRRKLFALFPFFTASIFFNDAMREAHAASITSEPKGSYAPQTDVTTAASSILQAGLSKILAAALVIGISTALVLELLSSNDDPVNIQISVQNPMGQGFEELATWQIYQQDDKVLETQSKNLSTSLAAGPYQISVEVNGQVITKSITLHSKEDYSDVWVFEMVEENVENTDKETPSNPRATLTKTEVNNIAEDKESQQNKSIAEENKKQHKPHQPHEKLDEHASKPTIRAKTETNNNVPESASTSIVEEKYKYKGPSLIAAQTQIFSDGERESNKLAVTKYGFRMNIMGGSSEFIFFYEKEECVYINNVRKVYVSMTPDSKGRCNFAEDTTSSFFDQEMSEGEELADEGLFMSEACASAHEKEEIESETISGFATIKYECIYGEGSREVYHWFAPDLGIVIKDEVDGLSTELTNIQLKKTPNEYFAIPEGYQAITEKAFMSLMTYENR